VRHGDPRQAVELLDRGRGVLAAQALATRTEFTDLVQDEPDLAARLERIRAKLAKQVYRALAVDRSAVAHALHHAVRALRATARPTNGVGIAHPCRPVNSRSGGGWTRWCC
jgi:hypothetical protein